jgi:hypothetical protein
LVGTAVKVTVVPAHIELPGLTPILIKGATIAFTVIVILLDVAVTGLAQAALLVKTHVTICPFVNVVVVNVALLVPAFTPFTFH